MFTIGQQVRFHDGQRGIVAAIINGGTLYAFRSNAGPTFTVRADELAPEGVALKTPAPLAQGECRTIYRMDAPQRQRTPAQQQQSQHAPDDDRDYERQIEDDEAAFEARYAGEHPDDDYLGRPA